MCESSLVHISWHRFDRYVWTDWPRRKRMIRFNIVTLLSTESNDFVFIISVRLIELNNWLNVHVRNESRELPSNSHCRLRLLTWLFLSIHLMIISTIDMTSHSVRLLLIDTMIHDVACFIWSCLILLDLFSYVNSLFILNDTLWCYKWCQVCCCFKHLICFRILWNFLKNNIVEWTSPFAFVR
jgi:hypothetical protein